MKKRLTEEQIIGILREVEQPGAQIRGVVRKHNITEQTFFRWSPVNTEGVSSSRQVSRWSEQQPCRHSP